MVEQAANATTQRPVLVIVGPSASGKSSLARRLHQRRVIRVHPTWTTRPRREDERAGSLEHRFVSDTTFDALSAQGFFIETATPFGLGHRYGLPALPPPSPRLVDAVILRAPFVDGVARCIPDQLVYQIEETYERARARLLLRAGPPAELRARLDSHHDEIAAGRRLAHRVIVNDGPLDALASAVTEALRSDLTGTTASRGGHPA